MHSKALGRTQAHSRFAPSTLRNAFCIAINRNQHSRLLHQLFAECLLRVEPEALSGLGTTGAARPLVGGGLGDGGDEERLDPDPRIVHLMREVIRCTRIALRWHSDAHRCFNHARTFCLAKPGSTTYTIPSIVREVSAMFVEKIILRPGGPPGFRGGGGGSKMARWRSMGNVE